MTVLTLSPHEFNYVFGAQDDYFILSPSGHEPLLIRNRCPHRGGPLHLAEFEHEGNKLICPLHGTAIPHSVLRRTAVPLVSRADSITAVLDEPPGGLTAAHRIILGNQASQCAPRESWCADQDPAAKLQASGRAG